MRELEYPSYPSAPGPRLHWSAVIAGTVVTLTVMTSLSFLGIGIGLLAAPAADSAKGLAMGMGVGGSMYMLIAGIVSYFVGGWFASRLSECGRPSDGAMFGLVTWGTATLVAALVFTAALSSLFGSIAGAAGTAASGAAQGAGVAAQGSSAQDIQNRIQDRIRDIGRGDPRDPAAGVDRGDVVQTAETASKAAGGFGLFAAITLMLQGVAAAIGGRMGARLYLPVPVSQYRELRRETMTAGR
jgi:hypothetical protein